MRRLTLGFETGTLPWLDGEVIGDEYATTPSIESGVVRTGSYALRCNSTGNQGFYAECRKPDGNYYAGGDTLIHRGYLWVDAAPGTGVIMRGAASNDQETWTVTLNSNGRLTLKNTVANKTKNGVVALSLDTWYRIEVKHVIANTGGSIEMRLYDDDDINPTLLESIVLNTADGAGDTLASWGDAGRVVFKCFNQNVVWDDIGVNDGAGSFQNDWLGPGRINAMRPDADTAVSWTRAGSSPAGTNFGGVDEVDPNDGVDYNESTDGTGAEDKLGLPSAPVEIPGFSNLQLLDVYCRFGGNQTGSPANMRLRLWDDAGTPVNGDSINCQLNGWASLGMNGHLVYDATAKDPADLANFSVGYATVDGSGLVKRVSTVWINVEWREAASETETVTPSPVIATAALPAPAVLVDGSPPTTTVTPAALVATAVLTTPTVIVITLFTHPGRPTLVRVNEGDGRLAVVQAGSEVFFEVHVHDITKQPAALFAPERVSCTLIDPCGDVILSEVQLAELATGKYTLRHQTRVDDEKGVWTAQFKSVKQTRAGLSPVYAVFKLT